ncbi:MAG: PDZ domain-containing protein [Acidobacteria bacterium]|nr:PDZ domain-containing protein [Acidobacteriota bacterium]
MKLKRCPVRAALLMLTAALCLLAASGWQSPARAQSVSSFERERYSSVLNVIKSDIKKNYYDVNYHGINLDEHFKQAEDKLKQATSVNQMLGVIAQTLIDFNDSHLFFIPPGHATKVEYGWQMQMIGDKCFVSAVKPGSDAEAKGLKPGDQILSLDGFEPSRDEMWKIQYYYYALRPRAGITLVIQDPTGKQREVTPMAKVQEGKRIKDYTLQTSSKDVDDDIRESQTESRLERNRLEKVNDDLIIWKMPTFVQSPSEMDSKMNEVRKYKALILDLRGNGGGRVDALERLVGNFFDHDVKIADLQGRKKMDPQLAKTRGKDYFTGKLIVLVDSRSGSASEIFARAMQIEKRGLVLGDRSAGAVMQSLQYPHFEGIDTGIFYGASVTNADVIMTDGKSIEHVGVTPDETVLLTGADLAAGRDTVIARAAKLLDVELSAEDAGKLFPIEWKK